MPTLTMDRAETLLADGFSKWVCELDLRFDAITEEGVVMRMPFDPKLCRAGGIVCGQAFMALADTASVFGMWAVAGDIRACTTVDLSTQMMRPISDADVLATTRVLRLGRSMAFVQVLLTADGDPRPAVNAQVTLALV
ncbi:PaaI family thioesterase [Euzebya rosea]|uniref:PaaI family thioesterase n=1 Tax=Euzebya rosea TaxID=2052804 RepID=UPI000D3E755F|nr:PaaI family thioesterase [Euzebya rosea]